MSASNQQLATLVDPKRRNPVVRGKAPSWFLHSQDILGCLTRYIR